MRKSLNPKELNAIENVSIPEPIKRASRVSVRPITSCVPREDK